MVWQGDMTNTVIARAFAKEVALSPVALHIAGPAISAILWLFILTWAGWRIGSSEPRERRVLRGAQLILGAGFVLYLLGLLMLYQRSFLKEEGMQLASYERYVSIYLLGWIIAILGIAAAFLEIRSGQTQRNAFFYLTALPAAIIVIAISQTPGLDFQRGYIRGMAKMLAKTPSQSRIYIICQHKTGDMFFESRYELSPHPTNTHGYSISAAPSKDKFTETVSPQQWRRKLLYYDYALILHADDEFWRDYAGVFTIGPAAEKYALFAVNKSAAGAVLRPA